jgi:hypothetical protein
VPDLLRGLLSDRAKIRECAWQNISSWQRVYGIQGWIRPSPETLGEIAQLWAQVLEVRLDAPKWVEASWSEFRQLVTVELGALRRPG